MPPPQKKGVASEWDRTVAVNHVLHEEMSGSIPYDATERRCDGSCAGTGGRLLIALTWVRFPPSQLNGMWRWHPAAAKEQAITGIG